MAERKSKLIEYERLPGENYDILRLSLRVPRLSLPGETGKHIRTAESEMLLAVRTLIDELGKRLSRLGKKGETDQEPAKGEE